VKIRKVGKMVAKKIKLFPFPTDTNSGRKMVGIFQKFPPFFLWSVKRLKNQIFNKWLQNRSVFPTETKRSIKSGW